MSQSGTIPSTIERPGTTSFQIGGDVVRAGREEEEEETDFARTLEKAGTLKIILLTSLLSKLEEGKDLTEEELDTGMSRGGRWTSMGKISDTTKASTIRSEIKSLQLAVEEVRSKLGATEETVGLTGQDSRGQLREAWGHLATMISNWDLVLSVGPDTFRQGRIDFYTKFLQETETWKGAPVDSEAWTTQRDIISNGVATLKGFEEVKTRSDFKKVEDVYGKIHTAANVLLRL